LPWRGQWPRDLAIDARPSLRCSRFFTFSNYITFWQGAQGLGVSDCRHQGHGGPCGAKGEESQKGPSQGHLPASMMMASSVSYTLGSTGRSRKTSRSTTSGAIKATVFQCLLFLPINWLSNLRTVGRPRSPYQQHSRFFPSSSSASSSDIFLPPPQPPPRARASFPERRFPARESPRGNFRRADFQIWLLSR
jgi:hypothetical protein